MERVSGMDVMVKATVETDHGNGWYVVRTNAGTALTVHDDEIVKTWDEGAEFRVSPGHPGTSKAIEPTMRKGTFQSVMLELFDADYQIGQHSWLHDNGHGYTDDELEAMFGRTHQSVSATRNTLMRKGLIEDSGAKRQNRSGNLAIVWKRTPVQVKA